jgi:hypothetical protein
MSSPENPSWNTLSDNTPLFVPTEDGKGLYLSRRLTGNVKAEFENWLMESAWRRIFRIQKRFDASEFKKMKETVAVSVVAMSWGSDACLAALESIPGSVKIASLLAEKADKNQDCSAMRIMQIATSEASGDLLKNALKEVMDASPNFLEPPSMDLEETE